MQIIPVEEFQQLTESDCIKIQEALAINIKLNSKISLHDITTVAGVDLAYWGDETEHAVCCIVVLDCQTGEILEKVNASGEVAFPYIPGCLAFRELPLVVAAAAKLTSSPDVYMFDGNGVLHPRKMGLATHAAFYLNAPTFGVAKSYYKVGETQLVMPQNEAGAFTSIIIDGEERGRTLRTLQDVKPVFVSVGNFIDIATATALTRCLTNRESHIPVPTRYADLETRAMRTLLKNSGS